VFVTGTDRDTFLPLADRAAAFAAGEGMLRPDSGFLVQQEATAPVPEPL
jgi:hypothetical protein